MNTRQSTIEAIEALPRYRGDKIVNGPDSWSLAFCKKLDERSMLSADLADAVKRHHLTERVDTGSLRRHDLIVRNWAGGRSSIDVVVDVRPADEHQGGGWIIHTTDSGGMFRVQSRMWTTTPTQIRVEQVAR